MDKHKIINNCYRAIDTDIPPDVFEAVLDALERSGYVLDRTGAWDQPIIDLCPTCQTPMTSRGYMADAEGHTEFRFECPACNAKGSGGVLISA